MCVTHTHTHTHTPLPSITCLQLIDYSTSFEITKQVWVDCLFLCVVCLCLCTPRHRCANPVTNTWAGDADIWRVAGTHDSPRAHLRACHGWQQSNCRGAKIVQRHQHLGGHTGSTAGPPTSAEVLSDEIFDATCGRSYLSHLNHTAEPTVSILSNHCCFRSSL